MAKNCCLRVCEIQGRHAAVVVAVAVAVAVDFN